MSDNTFSPLTKDDRRKALLLAAQVGADGVASGHTLHRLTTLIMRYENALMSVGYTSGEPGDD